MRRPWGACWMVAEGGEGENPLQPGGWGAGGGGAGRGGIPASFPSRSPPPKQPFQRGLRKIVTLRGGPRPWWASRGPRPQAPGDLAHRPLRRKPMGPGLKTLGCYHNPQSADLGGRWMVSEGGALQSHERRVPVVAPAFQPQEFGDLANKSLSPASRQPSRVKNSKDDSVLIGS